MLFHVAPAVVYVAAIFYSGLIRLGPLPEVGPVPTDKLLHAITFGGLVFLLEHALRYLWSGLAHGSRLACAMLTASVLGAVLELLQSFTVYRSADFFDWLADTIGALLVGALLILARQLLAKRSHA